jgi:3-deoxy-7-phosphoheptulonate synthase
MLSTTSNRRWGKSSKVEQPTELKRLFSGDATGEQRVSHSRKDVAEILHGKNDRLLVVVGPCSIHDPYSAREYAKRLVERRHQFRDDLEILMRVYFEKPRTTVGWKGLINDPFLDGSCDIGHGLRLARQLLLEFLDLATPHYLADLVSWGAIGARTTESQIHRELASGLPCPIGFKNGTQGNVQVAIDAIRAASREHVFLAADAGGEFVRAQTAGNPDCHIILRGGKQPNYDAQSVQEACHSLESSGLPPYLVIDASHGNSGKDHENQLSVCASIAAQVTGGDRRIAGVMIESNLVAGKQVVATDVPLVYGQSITDGCIGWGDTVECLDALASAVRERRRGRERASTAQYDQVSA